MLIAQISHNVKEQLLPNNKQQLSNSSAIPLNLTNESNKLSQK